MTQVILEFALLSDVLDDDLVTVRLALIDDPASAEPNSEGCPILPLLFNFQRISTIQFDGLAQ